MMFILECFYFGAAQYRPVYIRLLAMPDVFGVIFGRLNRQSVSTDGGFFRLNYRITVIILVASAWLLIMQGLLQDPVECAFADSQDGDFNRYCSPESIFSLRRKVTLVKDVSSVEGSADEDGINLTILTYYQLGPITLLLQAVLFYIPRYLWILLEKGKMKMLVNELITSTKGEGCSTKDILPLVSYFRKNIHTHDEYAHSYMVCEVLNLLNLGVQLQLLNIFTLKRFLFSDIYAMFTGQPTGVTHMTGELLLITTECTHAGSSDGLENPGNITGICPLLQNSINEQITVLVLFWMFILTVYGILVILYRYATCLFSSLRWMKFRSSCSLIPDETITIAYKRLKMGDWFVLLMLRKNINGLHYEELISHIAENYEYRISENIV